MRYLLLTLFCSSLVLHAEEGRLDQGDIMVKVLNHYIHLMPAYKKVTIEVLGITPSAAFIARLDLKDKEYLEFRDGFHDDVTVLKISILGTRHVDEHDIDVIEVSHRDSRLSGTRREYRYHVDYSGETDRFVFISDTVKGIY